jgi:hypothetical protein
MALRRAMENTNPGDAACWTRQGLANRRARFTRMDSAFSAYERFTELNEGLATYVQLRARGIATVQIPSNEFRPAEVRLRSYTIGPALAILLDRFSPGWHATLESEDRNHLDDLLERAVQNAATGCAFTAAESQSVEQTARRDSAALVAAWTDRERAFERRPGWRVIIEAADGQPLWPQNFDPLNLERVHKGLLHTRWLSLGNDGGQMRAIDEADVDLEAITESVGPHPLFNGVRRVVVTGLARPTLQEESGRVVISGTGLTARFDNATVHESGNEIRIQLRPRR